MDPEKTILDLGLNHQYWTRSKEPEDIREENLEAIYLGDEKK
jgi:hypothetical protein